MAPVCIPVEVTSIGLPNFHPDVARKAGACGKESNLLALQFLQSWDIQQGRQMIAAEVKASHTLECCVESRQHVIPLGCVDPIQGKVKSMQV